MNFSAPQYDILTSSRPYNLFMAGYGSGKTHLLSVIAYYFIYRFPQVRGFIGANTYQQLSQSTMRQVFKVWKEMGITEWSEGNPSGQYVKNKIPPKHFKPYSDTYLDYNGIISFNNGWHGYLGSLDNAGAHAGKEFGWACIDELWGTRKDDYKDIILSRLRQKGIVLNGKEVCPAYAFTTPAKTAWINDMYELNDHVDEISALLYDKEKYYRLENDKFCVTISSTHHNLHNLPSDYIENLSRVHSSDKLSTIIYANPFGRAGGEYYPSFERKRHVTPTQYDPTLPLHLSFDFNYVPYNPAGLFQIRQIDKIWHVYMVDEFALTSPHNSVEHVCEKVLGRYGNHRAGWFIYGDATGKSGTIAGREQRSYWQTVWHKFGPYITEISKRVPRANKPNNVRRDFCGRVFEDKLPVRIHIGEHCKHMINDFMYCKEDAEGGKDKKTIKDENGQSYQPYGHFGDLYEYFMLQCFAFLDKRI